MKSIEFVKNIIDELVIEFPLIQCKYQFKIESDTHFIEVLPNSVYNLDKKYAEVETKVTLDFINNYPQEGICFVSADSIVSVENPIYVKKGQNYSVLPTFILSNQDGIYNQDWYTKWNISVLQNPILVLNETRPSYTLFGEGEFSIPKSITNKIEDNTYSNAA